MRGPLISGHPRLTMHSRIIHINNIQHNSTHFNDNLDSVELYYLLHSVYLHLYLYHLDPFILHHDVNVFKDNNHYFCEKHEYK